MEAAGSKELMHLGYRIFELLPKGLISGALNVHTSRPVILPSAC